MTHSLHVTLLAALLATAAAADAPKGEAKPVLVDGVAAYVNAETITIADVMGEVRRSPWADATPQQREQRLRELYTATLNALIDRKLILAAARKANMQLQDWAVDNRIREIVVNNFDGDQTKLHNLLADRKISYQDWRKNIEEDLMVTAMRYQQVEKRVSPTPSEIRAEFDAHKGRYQTESAVSVSMIILDPPDDGQESVESRAQKILAALQSGTPFAELARTYSCDGKAANGGSWGKVVPEDVFRPEITEELTKLGPGETSPLLILNGYGYIIRKDQQQDSRPLTFEEAAPYVESRLKIQQADKLYKEWSARLREQAYIRIFELPTAQ